MDRKLDCEVDVEGTVDMMDHEEEEEGESMIRRPNTAGSHEPQRQPPNEYECPVLWKFPFYLCCTS